MSSTDLPPALGPEMMRILESLVELVELVKLVELDNPRLNGTTVSFFWR